MILILIAIPADANFLNGYALNGSVLVGYVLKIRIGGICIGGIRLRFLLMHTFWMDTHSMDTYWWDTCWTDLYWWDTYWWDTYCKTCWCKRFWMDTHCMDTYWWDTCWTDTYWWDTYWWDTFWMDMCGICVVWWICVGYVWCEICVGYVWCEIRQQSSEEPCDETSFGKKIQDKALIQENHVVPVKGKSVDSLPLDFRLPTICFSGTFPSQNFGIHRSLSTSIQLLPVQFKCLKRWRFQSFIHWSTIFIHIPRFQWCGWPTTNCSLEWACSSNGNSVKSHSKKGHIDRLHRSIGTVWYSSYINFSIEVGLINVIQLKSTYIIYRLNACIDLSRIAYMKCAPVFGSYKMIEIAMDFHFANPCLCDRWTVST